MKESTAMQNLPPYLFARIEKKIEEARQQGWDVISLGIGDPDQPTPEHIIAALVEASRNPENHQYPSSVGLLCYREAVARWYKNRFGVDLDPYTEVVSLLGSKEGIAHISMAYLDPGDINLVPDPGYPVYGIGTQLAGGTPYLMPLKEENRYLPVLEDIPDHVAKQAKLMFINYPNNPTGAVANREFYQKVVEFARSYDILVCHDAAYSEISYDGCQALSFLQIPGAKEVGVEFHSLSKTYNMTGWRIGWMAGNREAVEVMGRFKSNVDSGVFQAIQYAGIAALEGPQDSVEQLRKMYQERRDAAIEIMRQLGWSYLTPQGSFYMWVKVPPGYTSAEYCEYILEKAKVVITPGNGYGQYGEGYFRIALTVDKSRIIEALQRIKELA
ncbi:MAG TPA: LL-diaminopimelate aminotransferase [Syntrophomonadaceae bacterium]|nr:LL-diaminopimelate aminotransferase [Syntrophomonadaceae bacterium]HPU48971.1 LL-diaminopimelate aminotransferase [Syntrophomonadaceae bacterium]